MKKPLVFITNDDGVHAKGLRCLIELLRPTARILVVAPEDTRSGMSHAITMTHPLYLKKIESETDLEIYACSGTPVDCVKLAFDGLMLGKEQPSLILSGINHGSNSAINVLYSGTMAAAIEGSFYNIPAIGLSLLSYEADADFSGALAFIPTIIEQVLRHKSEGPFCANVNIPNLPSEQIKGIRSCRQNRGYWREEFEQRQDPRGRNYFWLTGYFHNVESDACDTDECALQSDYISVVPIQVDLTDYTQLKEMHDWDW